jgi:hypothetical protein
VVELVPVLEEHLAARRASARRLAVHKSGGSSAPEDQVPAALDEGCASVGVTGSHFHDQRGSGTTWAAVAGATLPELMHRLAHRAHTAELRYQHPTSERHREIADRLGALLRPDATTDDPAADVVQIRKQR